MRLYPVFAVVVAGLLGGCSLFGSSDEPPPIGASYDMVDSHGAVVGKVEFSPMSQGKVLDAKGNLIGNISKP